MSIPEVQSRSRLLAFLKNFFAGSKGAYVTTTAESGLPNESVITAGDNITFDTSVPNILTIDASGGGGGGDVSVSGTPSSNEVPIWTDSTTIKGDPNFTFDGSAAATDGYLHIKNTVDDGTTNRTMLKLHNYRSDDADVYDWGPISIDFDIENLTGGAKTAQARISAVAAPVGGDSHGDPEGETSSGLIFSTMLGDPSPPGTLNEAMRINQLGYVGIGTTTVDHLLTVATDVASTAVSSVTQYNNSTAVDGPNLLLQRARGTMASPAIVQDDDNLGSLRWYSYDGSNFDLSAGIMAECDATPGSNDTPGRLLFSTTADGANTLTERMRIDSAGLVTIAGDLTVTGGDITLGAANGYIKDAGGTNRITIADDTSVALLSPAGNAEFVVYETYCKTMSDLAVGGNVQCLTDTSTEMTLASGEIQFFAKGDDLMELTQTGVGILGATPIAGLAVTGDLEPSGDATIGGTLASNSAEIITSNTGLTYDRALFVQNTADHCNIQADAAASKDPNIVLSENTAVKWAIGNDSSTDNLRFRPAAFGTAVAQLTQTGDFEVAGFVTLPSGVTSALGAPISTDLSAADEWVKVAEVDLEHGSFQVGAATIDVILMGNEDTAEMYQARCHLYVSRYYYSNSQLQVDIIQDEGSIAWDTTDFILTQETSGTKEAQLYVRTPATNQSCYATITNGSSDGEENYKSDWYLTPGQTWAGSYTPLSHNPTTTNVKKRFDSLVIDDDLTMGAATSYIRDAQGHQRISIAGTGNIVLYDASGGTEFTVTNGSCTVAGNCTVSGDLFVNDYARIDALRIGTTSLDPGVDGNLYIEGATTAVGQITPGFDPGLIAQQILDPSGYALFGITEDLSYLYRVVWSAGDTSCTDPSVTFTAPVSGRVMVEVSCYMDNAPSPTYVYAALSTSSGTKITTTDTSIAGVQKFVWGPDEADKGTREFRFYVGGLSGGSSYTYYLYLRITNTQTTRVICGGAYPVFEMSVRPTLSTADVYSA